MGSKAFESPLISHVRMRAMYRALAEVRHLATLGTDRSFRGVEACWVGTAIDLKDGDLTSDTGGAHDAGMLAHLREVGLRPTAAGVASAALRKRLTAFSEASTDVFPGSSAERLLCAAGAAMALKAAGQGVIVAYVRGSDLRHSEWKQVLRVVGQPALPLIVMVLPGEGKAVDLAAAAKKHGVPVIPVEAGDAVALYRVTQETIVRARAGGGAAVIEGIACGTDALALLGKQLVTKGICTPRWIEQATLSPRQR